MNGASGFEEVQSSTPDHQPIGSCTSNSINSEQVPGTTYASQLTKQASMHATRRIVLLCLSIAILFSGCSSFSSTLGYRPEFPTTFAPIHACDNISENDAKEPCKEFYNIVKWGEEIAQAYTTKAFMNEWSVYAAAAVGIIGGAVVGTLTATDQGNTDAAKITPLVTAAVASLFALNQSDDKAAAYSEAVIVIEEAQATADRHVRRNKTKDGFQAGSEILTESIRQQIVNLEKRMAAIRKKVPATIPTISAMTPHVFKEKDSPGIAIFTAYLEDDPSKVRIITAPQTAVINTVVKPDRVEFTLDKPQCRDYMVMLSVENKLVLPPRNLRCEKTGAP